MLSPLAWYNPDTWLTTSCESLLTRRKSAFRASATSIPASRASYSTSLLVALNSNLKQWLHLTPSGLVRMIPAPYPDWFDTPSMYRIHALQSSGHSGLIGLGSELIGVSRSGIVLNSAMKSGKTWALMVVL